jgi:hypothetical protein
VVLGESVDLLLCPLLREVGYSFAIPSDLPTGNVSESELRTDRVHHGILMLDYLQCHLQLYSRQLFLDTQH